MATKGVLCGDSIVQNMYNNAHPVLEKGGNTVVKLAVAATVVNDQYNTWLASAQRGDPTVGWVYIKCGINDVIAGTAAATVLATMTTWWNDIRAQNPTAVIFLEQMNPAKSKLDTVSANRYPIWLALNSGYAGLGGRTEISNAVNNGADSIQAQYDNGDGLHLNPAGDTLSAGILRYRRDLTFGGAGVKILATRWPIGRSPLDATNLKPRLPPG